MLNKNDPLVGAIQDVMRKNQAERDAVKAVNEKFGVQDRRVLPREKQGEWDAAYQTVLTEGVEALDEKVHPSKYSKKQDDLAATAGDKEVIDGPDLEHIRKHGGKHIGEGNVDTVGKGENEGGSAVTYTNAKKSMGDLRKGDAETGMGRSENLAHQGNSVVTKTGKNSSSVTPSTMKEAVMNKIMKKLQEGSMKDTMGEFKRGTLHSGSKTGPIVKSRDQAIAIGMNSKKTVKEAMAPSVNVRKASPPPAAAPASPPPAAAAAPASQSGPASVLSRKSSSSVAGDARGGNRTPPPPPAPATVRQDGPASVLSRKSSSSVAGDAKSGGARPIAPNVGTRPSVVAKNSGTGSQKSTGSQIGGARPSVVAKNSGTGGQTSTGSQIGGARPSVVAKNSPTAKAPVPKSKPTTGSVAPKLKPVRKQPSTGTVPGAVKRPSVAAKPKLTPLQQQMRRSKTGRNAEAGPGNS